MKTLKEKRLMWFNQALGRATHGFQLFSEVVGLATKNPHSAGKVSAW